MRIFLTGASGFIGSRILLELIHGGHQVVGLSPSDEDTKFLITAGAEVHKGVIEDLESLRSGAAKADGVIHCAFNNDFEHLAENCEKDRHAIEALGDALVGSNHPLVVTSFTGIGNTVAGQPALEKNLYNPSDSNPRVASEIAAASVSAKGVKVSVIRLPMVHDPLKQGVITAFIALARKKRVSAYVGEGLNCFPAAHVDDVARLYRLALEKQVAGSTYHAVDEEGVPFRAIAKVIGQGLKVPVVSISPKEAKSHFEFLAPFSERDLRASGLQTQKRLEWHPTGATLMADLEQIRF